MIERGDDRPQLVAQRNEIDYVGVFVQWSSDFRGQAIIVAMQALAHVTGKRDEMRGAEHHFFFRDANKKLFGHKTPARED